MSRKIYIYAFVLVFLSFAVMGNGYAAEKSSGQTKVKFALGHIQPEDPNDPYNVAAKTLRDKVAEYTKGNVTIDIFPNAQLGDERVLTEGVQNGIVDIAVITSAVTGNFQPLTKVLDLPFIFNDEASARKIMRGEIGRKILDSMEEARIKGLALSENGMRGILNNVKPIKKPDDLKNLKMRVMQNPLYIDFYKALNANPVPLAWGEVYTAVQQKTVDGLDLAPTVIQQVKINEVTKYLSDIKYSYSAAMIIMNLKKFNELSRSDQDSILKAAGDAREAAFKINSINLPIRLKNLEKTMKITQHNEIDIKAFKELMKPVWNKYAGSGREKEILDKILAAGK